MVLLVLAGCAAHAPRAGGQETLLSGVPFYPDDAYQCGPSSLAAVLNFWKAGVTREEVAAAIFSASARSTLTTDMAWFAREKGFEANSTSGSLDAIRGLIEKGQPVILFVDLGIGPIHKGHYMVVVGVREDGVVANTGRKSRVFMSRKHLSRIWERTDRWMLVIEPPHKAG